MNYKVRIIKREDRGPKEPKLNRREPSSRQSAREITGTIKLWVSEFKERSRAHEHRSRSAVRLMPAGLSNAD
jgi:hypothetical protein